MLKLSFIAIAILLGFLFFKNDTTKYKNMETIIQEIINKKPRNQAEVGEILGVSLKKETTLSNQYYNNFQAKGIENAAFEAVEVRLPVPNSGATGGWIIVFEIPESQDYSKDQIYQRYGAGVEFVIARPEDRSQTNYLSVQRPGYSISYRYKGEREACTGIVLNFEKPKEKSKMGVKMKSGRIYEENPGFKCGLSIKGNSVENIEAQLTISNKSSQDLYLWQKKLPSTQFHEECIVIENLETDKNEIYHGEQLDRNAPIEKPYIVSLKAKQETVLKSNLASCFNLKKGTKYRIKYNTWMPLLQAGTLQTASQVLKYSEKEKSTLPVYFLIESDWEEFNF
jgi:hypothetical protein